MQQNNQRKRAVDIGSYVPEAYAMGLMESWKMTYPGSESSFIIPVKLILEALSVSDSVKGVRFMYGLTDLHNPNSVRVLLIPCTASSEYAKNSRPLLLKYGYKDHLGVRHNIKETAQLIANWAININGRNKNLVYKQITRGSFIGRNSYKSLTQTPGTEYINLNFGWKDNILCPVFQTMDSEYSRTNNLSMDILSPCPPCDPDPCLCAVALAFDAHGRNGNELNLYKEFRDDILLTMPGGNLHYELYYFASPLISLALSLNKDSEDIQRRLYFELITPLVSMLETKQYHKALDWLDKCLNLLISEYTIERASF